MPKVESNPGTVFKSFLDEFQLTPAKFAEDIKLSQSSVRLLINNKLKISVAFALRFAKYFGNKPEFWIELQNSYELSEVTKDPKESGILKSIQKAKKPAAVQRTAKTGAAPRGAKAAAKTTRKSAAEKE
jgi:addiction module HigA family antidote